MRPNSKSAGHILLPEHFMESLRIIFELLDPNRTGFISYEQLCNRWDELPIPTVPRTVLEHLNGSTLPDGTLTYDRFVGAIRQSITDKLDRSENNFENHENRRNGPATSLNGVLTTTAYSAPSAVSSTSGHSSNGHLVRMRPKKGVPVKQQQELQSEPNRSSSCIRFRPASINSYVSLASSGMSDIRWRDSHVSSCSSTPSSWQLVRESPQMMKHEGYLDEEKEMINRGLENAKKLIVWYNERLKSLQKRANLLTKGLVTVDSAVHEQKLNYLRAHIAELNRRITSLVESSERGFPTYSNLQVRTQMPQPNDDRSQYYQRQNIKLCQELADKDKIIERLMREKEEASCKYNTIQKVEPKSKCPEGLSLLQDNSSSGGICTSSSAATCAATRTNTE